MMTDRNRHRQARVNSRTGKDGGDEVRPLGDDQFVPWHGIAEALAEIP